MIQSTTVNTTNTVNIDNREIFSVHSGLGTNLNAAGGRVLHQSLGDGKVGLEREDILIGVVEQYPSGSSGVILPARHVGLEAVVEGSHLVHHAGMLGIRRVEHKRESRCASHAIGG